MPTYTALFDACVLYPQTLRDVLLSLARTELFRARWSDDINREWTESLAEKYPDKADDIQRTLQLVNESVPDCLVTGYDLLIPSLILPNPDDRHVVAAAIVGRADAIVTFDLKHFPPEILAPFGIDVQDPDAFIVNQIGLDPDRAVAGLARMRARLKRPPFTASAYLENLARKGLTKTAKVLESFVDRF